MEAVKSTLDNNILKRKSSVAKIIKHDSEKTMDEIEIWKRFKSGNTEAFIYIYQQYFSTLYKYAFQFSNDEGFIKDQIQDLFIYIRQNQQNLNDVKSVKFYLFSCLRRRILKSKKKQDRIHEKESFHYFFYINIEDSPEESMIKTQEIKLNNSRLKIALNSLNEKAREAIMYFYYENFSYQEICILMDLKNVKAARKLIYRALNKLNKKFPI